jgi:general stress protein 26
MATKRQDRGADAGSGSSGSSGDAGKPGKLDELWKLVEGIEIAMLTTRRADGHMVSRPMATQKRAVGADFWFATLEDMPKVREISEEPRVNLSYYKDRTREWVSISGDAEISRDRAKIRELWAPDWKFWFPDEGGKKDGSAEDPRIVLIGVRAASAQYMTLEKPQALVLFDVVKAKLTGKTPEFGEVKEIRLPGPRAAAASQRKGKTPGRSRARATKRKK